MIRKAALFLILAFVVFSAGYANDYQVYINEVMTSNATTIADEDGDYEDWIELFNSGQETIQLEGFGLSDDYDNPFRWIFPEISIPPGGFLLVWASGKDGTDPALPLHTNFRISQDGEEVLLTHPDGTLLDEMPPLYIPTDISYGRKPDGEESWFFFSDPTPGSENTTIGYSGLTEAPEIIVQHVKGRTFQVEIYGQNLDTDIYYTLDGSIPDQNAKKYQDHFVFEAPPDSFMYIRTTPVEADPNGFGWVEPEGPFASGAVIRALAKNPGHLESPVSTRSTFNQSYDLPVISIGVNPEYLFSDSIGIYVPGDIYNEHGWNPNDWWGAPFANYHQRGPEWERQGHFELFTPEGAHYAQNIGLRIHGGGSRTMPLKTLRLYARNQYSQSDIDFDIFENGSVGYKRLLLRNSGQDFMATMFRDAAIQAMIGHLNFDTQEYRPAVVFINGEYWGIHNIRERYDPHYLERNYEIEPDKLDWLTRRNTVEEGDSKHYDNTLEYIETHGLEKDTHYQHVSTRIDVENFTDYKIAQIFVSNTDWPHSNIDFWRLRTEEYLPDAPYGHDGRWRWLLYDTDFGFGFLGGNQYLHNTLAYATAEEQWDKNNPPWSTFLLRNFLQNQKFRVNFINRFADLLNTCFLQEYTTSVIDELKGPVEGEISEHIRRWGHPFDYQEWERKVGRLYEFSEKRPNQQRKHIREKFDIDDEVFVKLDVSNPLKGHIRINTIEIKPSTPGVSDNPYPWTGKYFKEISIKLEAIPVPGYRFSHWEGASISNSAVIELTPGENIQLKAHFERLTHHVMIHYWLFDTSLPNNTPLESIKPTYSISPGAILKYYSSLEGYPFDENHPLWRKASMERRNHPTPINYRPEGNQETPYEDSEMRGIQIREPFEDEDRKNTMIFYLPTNGYTDIVFGFAAINEEGAGSLLMDYSVSAENGEWTTQGLEAPEVELSDSYRFFTFDFSEIPEVNKNAYFSIRLRFKGEEPLREDPERVTFNNITLDGIATDAFNLWSSAGNNGSIEPYGRTPVFKGGEQVFTITPNKDYQIAEVLVDGQSMTDNLVKPERYTAFLELTDIDSDHHIHATFDYAPEIFEDHEGRVIIYPNPANEMVNISSLDKINRIEVFNLSGQPIKVYEALSEKEISINTRVLRNGIYIMSIRTEKEVVSKKLQILR